MPVDATPEATTFVAADDAYLAAVAAHASNQRLVDAGVDGVGALQVTQAVLDSTAATRASALAALKAVLA